MVKAFNVKISQRTETPSKANLKTLVDELDNTKKERTMDPKVLAAYRSRVGSLLYCARAVRIDTGYAVGLLCRCITYADERALQAADDCLAYLAAHDDLALTDFKIDAIKHRLVAEALDQILDLNDNIADAHWESSSTGGQRSSAPSSAVSTNA